MFIDFTQIKNYTFNNKASNLLVIKKVSNFILLLNEFNPKNLDALKNDKEIENASILNNYNIKCIMAEEDEAEDNLSKNKSKNPGVISKLNINKSTKAHSIKAKIKSKAKKASNLNIANNNPNISIKNISIANSRINLLNNSYGNMGQKGLKALNDDIHILNNKDLNDISNNSNKCRRFKK